MERCCNHHISAPRGGRWLPIALGVVCIAVGVPLFTSDLLQRADMTPLRLLAGLVGMTGLICTPFALLRRCFDEWEKKE